MAVLILSTALLFSPTQVLAGDGGQALMGVLQEMIDQDWQDQQRRGNSGTLPMRPTQPVQQQPQQQNCAYTANPSQCYLDQGFN